MGLMGWLEPAAMAARMDLAGPVACGPDRDWPALIARREAWRSAIAGAGARRVALHFPGTFEFAAALLGTWAAGATAVLPGDATEITIANLAPHADAFAGDFPDPALPRIAAPGPGIHGAGEDKGPAGGGRHGPATFPAIPIVLFTSGTTGVPSAVAKSAADVGNELRSLEAAFGTLAEGDFGGNAGAAFGLGSARARVLSTVGHQHIYGLLFRCLWPLAAGRPFADLTLRYPEELAEALAAPGPALLVASPAFLKRLPGGTAWPHPPAAVFSSGGPLPWEAAGIAARLFGSAPFEIYGSTETGGIAWRLRNAEDTPWTPFPGVAIALAGDGALSLEASPHLGGPFPFATADRAEWSQPPQPPQPPQPSDAAERRFRLLGRADRIVKLEEKRLSLAAMEALLCAHPRIAEAKLVVLEGPRETLGAVLRLREADPPLRGMPGREALLADLRAHLSRGFERVLLPRRWRLVLEMPANAAGKPGRASLAALFEPLHGPLILRASAAAADGSVRLELDIHPELEAFRGHFPEAPLLPGVVQVDWAIREGERRFGALGVFRGLKALKFQRPISPGMRVTLTLSRLPAKGDSKGDLAFAYDTPAGRHSAGQAQFA
jgi:acyl-coenzyme A synthetase/AMP-(fatty) acid ligase